MPIPQRIDEVKRLLEEVNIYNRLVTSANFAPDTITDMKDNAKDVCDQAKNKIDHIKDEINEWS